MVFLFLQGLYFFVCARITRLIIDPYGQQKGKTMQYIIGIMIIIVLGLVIKKLIKD